MTEKKLRADALAIFRAALKAADPVAAVTRDLERRNLARYRRIFVIGAGKAGATMALAAERVLGKRITSGLVNVKYGHVAKLKRIELNECGHPVPDERGLEGAARIVAIAQSAGPEDLVLCLISGGASALLPLPAEPISLAEKQETTKALLACGADIHEINAVRKHISGTKGGQLARLAAPASVLSLMLSDVIGDDLDVIGSGPTAPDSSTFSKAQSILDKYGVKAPSTVATRLQAGIRGEIPDTPKPGDPLFSRVTNAIVGSNLLAVNASVTKAKALGYRTLVLSTRIEGETRDIARMHAAIAKEVRLSGRPIKPPACIVSGGETTVTIRGDGKGGRNQEFVLAAAIDIAGLPGTVVLSGGTDGTDGPTDAAGAIADGKTLQRAADAATYLANNDSYSYFQKLNDLLLTGPTNTNVMDIRLMLIG